MTGISRSFNKRKRGPYHETTTKNPMIIFIKCTMFYELNISTLSLPAQRAGNY